MDGDVPDLAGLIKLKRRYNAWLMVDEAHATGALGAYRSRHRRGTGRRSG